LKRNGTSWTETQILTPSDNPAVGRSSVSVDVEGDDIVVGASYRGAVYVFALNGANVWEETDTIEASDGARGHGFGTSVDLSGGRIAVGACDGQAYGGLAYVYTRSSGPDSFYETALFQGDTTGDDFFGYQVAIVGDTAVVGALFNDNKNGAAYVFKRDPADESWSQATKLTSSESNGERLGSSVAISGDFVVAGALFSNLAARHAGAVFVFKNPTGTSQSSGGNKGGFRMTLRPCLLMIVTFLSIIWTIRRESGPVFGLRAIFRNTSGDYKACKAVELTTV
jgi:hypothetical protein